MRLLRITIVTLVLQLPVQSCVVTNSLVFEVVLLLSTHFDAKYLHF